MEDKKVLQSNKRSLRYTGITASVLLAVLLFSAVVGAWFYLGRKAAGVAEIANPTAIFINAGNAEDIRYLDLGGIDVENSGDELPGDPDKMYKDFVFCIRGTDVPYYLIQLAYTTNNQFEFQLFPATETSSESNVPSNNKGSVDYPMHDTAGTKYYYIANSETALAGRFLNKDTSASEILAKNNDTYHDQTYGQTGGTVYQNRHKYAIPLYWQTTNMIAGNAIGEFTHYYIMRVIWTSASQNNKETDIIYISAKNTQAQS